MNADITSAGLSELTKLPLTHLRAIAGIHTLRKLDLTYIGYFTSDGVWELTKLPLTHLDMQECNLDNAFSIRDKNTQPPTR